MSTAAPVAGPRRLPSAARESLTGLRRQNALPAIGALVVFVIVYAAVNPDLFTRFQLQTVANLVAPLAFVALAELLIVLIGGIDISVGAVMSLANVVFATLLATTSPVLALAAGLAVGVGCGAFNGALVSFGRLPTIATTLASAFIFGALAREVLDRPGGAVPDSVILATSGELVPYVPMAFVWLLIAAVGLWAFLNRTVIGRQIYGAGSNADALLAAGHSPTRARMVAFLVAGLLTGLAAVLLAGSTATGDPKSGDPYLLNAIAAVALGGASFAGGTGSGRQKRTESTWRSCCWPPKRRSRGSMTRCGSCCSARPPRPRSPWRR